MISVDTNVLARLIVNDDPEQGKRAAMLLKREDIFDEKLCKRARSIKSAAVSLL